MSPVGASAAVAAVPDRPQVHGETGFLPHVQALRAVAVLLVVLFHLWPARLTGGFVGVDVFFGISGFLIAGHLLREVDATGGIRLAGFWARRIRRLLPAAFLVLWVSLAGMLLLMPSTVWRQITTAIGASALYVENWHLARDSVDYFAADNIASPVQHYWSLSVQEQFYLVWPVLLLAVALAYGRDAIRFRRPAVTVMALVTAASLVYSVTISQSAQSVGYFSTFAHAWEFGLGALMAVLLRRGRLPLTPAVRAVLSWLGFAMIVLAGYTFSGDTLFPGYAALLPLGGAMLVIAAGHSTARWGPSRLVATAPVQYTGNISYSLYLWHWPLIVLLPFATGHQLTGPEKIGVLVACFVLAGMTKVAVEDRFRSSRWLTASNRRTYGVTALATALLVGACVWPAVVVEHQIELEQQQALQVIAQATAEPAAQSCFGAAAATHPDRCLDSHVVRAGFGPDSATTDGPEQWLAGNVAPQFVDTTACPFNSDHAPECRFGDQPSDFTVAVVGDSHARVLVTPVLMAAKARGWRVLLLWSGDCRAALPLTPSPRTNENGEGCSRWKQHVTDGLAERSDIDVVVTTGWTKSYTKVGDAQLMADLAGNFTATWDRWAQGGRKVLVVRDAPFNPTRSVLDCIAKAAGPVDPCSLPRAVADPVDPVDLALQADRQPGVHGLDLSSSFCDATTCHFVVGGVITTRDSHHMTTTFVNTLSPQIEKAITALGG